MTSTTTIPDVPIRAFTGFLAIDGTPHMSEKAALDYSRDLKIKAALAKFANITEGDPGVSVSDSGYPYILPTFLPEFLLAHREVILDAFDQTVRVRSQRRDKGKARAKKVEDQQPVAEAL